MNASGRLLARLTVLGALSASGMTAALPVHADDASPEPSQRSAATELAALHEAPWDRRGDFILSLKASLEVLSELPEAEQTNPLVQYELHTDHWSVFGFCQTWE